MQLRPESYKNNAICFYKHLNPTDSGFAIISYPKNIVKTDWKSVSNNAGQRPVKQIKNKSRLKVCKPVTNPQFSTKTITHTVISDE